MALTPEQIAKMDAITGWDKNPPTTAINPTSAARIAELDALVTPKQQNIFQRIKSDILQRGKNVSDAITGSAPNSQGENPLVRGVQATGQAFSGITDVGGEITKSLYQHLVPERARNAIASTASTAINSIENSQPVMNLATKINNWVDQHPDAGHALMSLLKTGEGFGQIAGGILTAEAGAKTAQGAVDLSKNVGNKVIQTAKDVTARPIEVAKNKVRIATQGRTPEEILSTPETQLHKLSPSERSYYFDNQKSLISEKLSKTEAAVKSDLQNNLQSLQKEAADLTRTVSQSSRDEVVRLRPKIIKSLSKQSAEYRRLVEEEVAGKADIKVNTGDLNSFIENRFQDEAQAQAIKNRLGIMEDLLISSVKKGELPVIQSSADTTVGELFNKTKSLRQDISSSAIKGARTFTPAEKLTDDSISTLTNFLKTKGVDLKEANQFWAKYAPVRNQLISESKPFLQTPIQTKAFASTITRVAKGVDVNNENFIKEVEKLVGEPIGKETKAALQGLAQNEKQQIAAEVEAQLKASEAKLAKQSALKALSDKQFNVERLASRQTIKKLILKSVAKYVLPSGGALYFGHKLGL